MRKFTFSRIAAVAAALTLAGVALGQNGDGDPTNLFSGALGIFAPLVMAVLAVWLYFFARWGGFRLLY